MPPFQIILVIVVAAISFAASWRKLGDQSEMDARSEESKRLLGVRFHKGFDGKRHLEPLPVHFRVALCLASSLGSAVVAAYFYTWLNKHGWGQ